jgi:biotin carboxylase
MKKAIVLGGTNDHIRLIELLKEKGYYVILIDYYENPPARAFADKHIIESTINKELILQLSERLNVSIIISTCVDSALATTAYVSEKLKLPCHIDYKTAIALTNKSMMKEVFLNNNIPSAIYKVYKDEKYPNKKEKFIYPIVVKPADANSSKGVEKVNNYEELVKATKEAYTYSLTKTVVIEEFIEGEEYSVDVMVVEGIANIILITKNIKNTSNTNKFTIIQSLYPAVTDEKIIEKIQIIANKIANAYRIKNSPLLIQVLNNNGKIYVIEFSARIGGGSKHHLIKYATGFDMLNAFVQILHGEIPLIKAEFKSNCIAINYIFGHNGRITQYKGIDELLNQGIIEKIFYYKTSGMEISGKNTSADRPFGYLISAIDKKGLQTKSIYINNLLQIIDENNNDIMLHDIEY